MTGTGYYDYAPTVALNRSIVCAGHPGTTYREIIYDLAALAGLPLHDLDRRVEHEAGQNLWSFAREHGREALHELETSLLPGVLAQVPPGLIVLGEGALLDEGQMQMITRQAALVFFAMPMTACYWALRQRSEDRGGVLMHPWLPDQLDDSRDLQALWHNLQPALDAADHVVDLTDVGVHEAVLALQDALPGLGAANAPKDGHDGI